MAQIALGMDQTTRLNKLAADYNLTGCQLMSIAAAVLLDQNNEVAFDGRDLAGTMQRLKASAPAIGDNGRQIAAALGSTIKFQNFNPMLMSTTGVMVDGTLRLQPIYVDFATLLTGAKWFQSAQGVYTADNNNRLGLYSYSAGLLTLVAASADNGNTWKGAATLIASAAFATPYQAAAGLYYIGILYNSSAQTTAPSQGAAPILTSTGVSTLDFANSAMIQGSLAAQTDLPATQLMSGLTAEQSQRWFALY